MSSLYLPGRGMVNLAETQVARAVSEYDEKLMFAHHPEFGQWLICIKIERDLPEDVGTYLDGQRVYPVLAFSQMPSADEALRQLHRADTMRHGQQMLDDMHAFNERQKEPQRRAAEEADSILAETVESYKRNNGETFHTSVFFNGPKSRNLAIKGH